MNKITIIYCVPCGYKKRAEDAAEAIKKELGITVTLVPGKGGIFQVKQGDEILTKRTAYHFPDTNEIVSIVAQAIQTAQ